MTASDVDGETALETEGWVVATFTGELNTVTTDDFQIIATNVLQYVGARTKTFRMSASLSGSQTGAASGATIAIAIGVGGPAVVGYTPIELGSAKKLIAEDTASNITAVALTTLSKNDCLAIMINPLAGADTGVAWTTELASLLAIEV